MSPIKHKRLSALYSQDIHWKEMTLKFLEEDWEHWWQVSITALKCSLQLPASPCYSAYMWSRSGWVGGTALLQCCCCSCGLLFQQLHYPGSAQQLIYLPSQAAPRTKKSPGECMLVSINSHPIFECRWSSFDNTLLPCQYHKLAISHSNAIKWFPFSYPGQTCHIAAC